MENVMRIRVFLLSAALSILAAETSVAQTPKISGNVVKIGVLGDFSGPFENLSGKGALEAVRMAVEDFGGTVLGKKIEVVNADHQNKPDIASNIARQWYDVEGVDMINDLAQSASALAVLPLAKQFNRIAIVNSASSTEITGTKCTPNSVHYTIDTYAEAKGTGTAILNQGYDSFFFLTADYAYGHSLERDVSEIVKARGGKIIGSVRHPFNTSDFSSFILQAQSSGAKVIALANAGGDTVNAIKAAQEFGVGRDGKQIVVGMLVFIGDVHALGLKTAQGLVLTTAFYWDLNGETRAWSKRFYERVGKMPQMTHAGDYSSTLHYLKAVQAAGTDDAQAVMEKMREMPVNDMFAKNGHIRADGLMVHDLLLVQVKKPEESARAWDYYKVLAVIPGKEAYKSLDESVCPLVKK
jgi:branched-chain amino acid transport system substrate-binding protein